MTVRTQPDDPIRDDPTSSPGPETNALPRTLRDFPLGAIENPVIDRTFPAAGLDVLRVRARTLGNLMICFDAEEAARVIAAGDQPLLPTRIEREGDELVLIGSSLGSYLRHGQRQKILIEVHVPRHARVDVEMLAGVVMLNGGDGPVAIRGSFGEIAGVTQTRELTARLKAGDVTLHELHANADIRVSVGSVTLRWSALDGSELIDVRCGLAGIDLQLPPGVAPVEDTGGLFKRTTVETPGGTRINAQIGFGGLDVTEWAADLTDEGR